MATAVDNVDEELQILDASENITLNDAERVKLIANVRAISYNMSTEWWGEGNLLAWICYCHICFH